MPILSTLTDGVEARRPTTHLPISPLQVPETAMLPSALSFAVCGKLFSTLSSTMPSLVKVRSVGILSPRLSVPFSARTRPSEVPVRSSTPAGFPSKTALPRRSFSFICL